MYLPLFAKYFLRLVLMGALLTACAPLPPPSGVWVQSPHLARAHFVTSDGAVLPVRRWLPEGPVRAVVVALHGFNDYSRFFTGTGEYLAAHGVAAYAYDQRGFGLAPEQGIWAGVDAYTRDLKEFVAEVRRHHPHTPLYVLGESMGGAVAIVALTDPSPLHADGVILTAPAVWGRETMPWYQVLALETLARLAPGMRLTGEGLHIQASDNREMLRQLARDPLVIKATRMDAVFGLTDLMDLALARTRSLRGPLLVLYGERDEVVPRTAVQRMLGRLPAETQPRVAVYENGYHLLLRDLGAERARSDILVWLANQRSPLPSGADRRAALWEEGHS